MHANIFVCQEKMSILDDLVGNPRAKKCTGFSAKKVVS